VNQVYLIIRRSFAYYCHKQNQFHHEEALQKSHVEGMARALNYWDDLFKCSFIDLRHQIASITLQHNLECLPDGVILHSDQAQLPSKGWIIPIDDDDVLDVRVISKVRKHPMLKQSLHWPVNVLNEDKFSTANNFTANSYAISAATASEPRGWSYLQRHCFAGTLSSKIISEKPLGLKINHPASLSMLKLYRDQQDCRRAIDKLLNISYSGLYKEVVAGVRNCFAINLR
jgi:hypothetical protein